MQDTLYFCWQCFSWKLQKTNWIA